jgi:pSer/pThr/pTyr-binding forkhead associated (FHA) protein
LGFSPGILEVGLVFKPEPTKSPPLVDQDRIMDVRLVVEKGSKKKREIRLKSEDTIIGRRTGCDLRVPSASVSRRHCRLSFRDDCLVVEDLQSANGTYLNGVRIKDTHIVRPGDRLEIGPVTFLVKYKVASAGEVTEREMEEIVPEFDMDEIELDEGAGKKRKKTIAEPKAPKKKPVPESSEKNKPVPKKPPEKAQPAAGEAGEDEELPLAFDESSWHVPAGEDIRDILSQMDEP